MTWYNHAVKRVLVTANFPNLMWWMCFEVQVGLVSNQKYFWGLTTCRCEEVGRHISCTKF